MPDKKSRVNKKQVVQIQEGFQPVKKGHQPIKGDLNTANPPQGGSGVPLKPSTSSDRDKKVDKK